MNFSTAGTLGPPSDELRHSRPQGGNLFDVLLYAHGVADRAATLRTAFQRDFRLLVNLLRYFAATAGMSSLATGSFLL